MAEQDRDKQLLETRISELERELAHIKAQASAAELFPTESQPPSQAPLSDADNWLIDTLRFLLTEHNSAGMGFALGQLGDFLGLVDCSLWRLDDRHRQVENFGRWQAEELSLLNQDRWVGLVLSDKAHCLAELQAGRPLMIGSGPAHRRPGAYV